MNDKLTGINFGEILQGSDQNNPENSTAATNSPIKDGKIEKLIAAFEAVGHLNQNGEKFWDAKTHNQGLHLLYFPKPYPQMRYAVGWHRPKMVLRRIYL
jgi:hypothetical protein